MRRRRCCRGSRNPACSPQECARLAARRCRCACCDSSRAALALPLRDRLGVEDADCLLREVEIQRVARIAGSSRSPCFRSRRSGAIPGSVNSATRGSVSRCARVDDVRREPLEYAELAPTHELARAASGGSGSNRAVGAPRRLPARRPADPRAGSLPAWPRALRLSLERGGPHDTTSSRRRRRPASKSRAPASDFPCTGSTASAATTRPTRARWAWIPSASRRSSSRKPADAIVAERRAGAVSAAHRQPASRDRARRRDRHGRPRHPARPTRSRTCSAMPSATT